MSLSSATPLPPTLSHFCHTFLPDSPLPQTVISVTKSAVKPSPAVPPGCCRRGHQTTRLPASDARGKGRCDECGDVVGLHDVVDFCVLKGEDEHDDCNFYCCKACTLRLSSEEVEEAKEVCLHHQHATAQPHITVPSPCSTHVYR